MRALYVTDDTEVYLLSRERGFSVLKIQRPSLYGPYSRAVRARLAHEAAFLANLGGVLAPRLLDKDELDGRFYIEIEFIEGVDAATAACEGRKRGGERGRQLLLRLAQTIARSYARLHERGVLHGNVHPGNVRIRDDATAILLDFAAARPAVAQTALPTPPDRGGTPFFFEPEMARVALACLPSMPASQPGEQHAVAALIYFLLTGAHWQNLRLGRDAMLEDIATLRPLSFRQRGVESWPEMEAVLGRALSKLPDARFPSMSAFAAALDAVTASPMTNGVSRTDPLSQWLERSRASAAPPLRIAEVPVHCITDLPFGLAAYLSK
jgi:serine/threonine-protein kinase